LLAGLLDEEDEQLLAGDNVGENLNGILTQATAFDTTLLTASDGWERADVIALAIQQVEAAKERVSGVIVNPIDWWRIVLTKDTTASTFTATRRAWGRPCYGADLLLLHRRSLPERSF
jgi:HK97 family phage major capsid protein